MSYSFKKPHSRILCLLLVAVMVMSLFAGCKKDSGMESAPSTEDNLPPGLVEVKPTETTTPPTEATEPVDENTAVVIVDELAVHQGPSLDDIKTTTLKKGKYVTIVREVNVGSVAWTLIREGWVPSDSIEKVLTPQETEPEKVPENPNNNNENKNNDGTTTTQNNNNNNNTDTGTKILGVVIGTELNIRKEPNVSGERVDSYKFGDRITIVETKNGWGRTNKGWISLDYVYQDGTKGAKPANGVITGNGLNVRSGPGTKYDAVDTLNFGARVNVLERLTINGTEWACIKGGWISMQYVYVDGTNGQGAGTGTVNANAVNVRSGPGTKFDAVASKNLNDPVTIYAQFQIGDMIWGCIGNGQWIAMQFVNMG